MANDLVDPDHPFDVPAGPMGGNPAPVKLNSKEEFDALPAGREFIDPEGKTRVKPYSANTPDEFKQVPEGAQFLDPEGQLRTKPTFEGIDYTAQTLYDMSVTDKERRKALERSYPGKVKEDAEGLYIDDDGKLRRPGRGISSVTGFLSSAAAPTALSALGALGGGAAGTVAEPGGGTVAGAAAGGAGGAMLGQSFNDMILGVAGIYDRSLPEEVANMAMAGASGMMGAGVGRGISTVVPSIKAGISAAGAAAPAIVRHFLGAGAEDLAMARKLTEQGRMVPASSVFKESPHLQNIAEIFDPAFRTDNPLQKSAVAHYEENAGKVLNELGVKEPGAIYKPEAAVSSKAAGEAVMQRTLAESAQADTNLAAALERRKAAAAAGQPNVAAQREIITKELNEAQAAAEKLINAGYADIRQSADNAFKVAKAGGNGGDLWEMVGAKLRAMRQAVAARAGKMYGDADQLAGGHLPNVEGLPELARDFAAQLPEEVKMRQPSIVRQIEALAGKQDPETGEWIKEPARPTFGQLHNLRSEIRGQADFNRLDSDLKNGTYKFFAKRVDDALKDIESVPELAPAVEALGKADAFYREQMPIFNAQNIKAVMRGLEAGEPADPKKLFDTIVKEGHTDLIERIKQMVGPNLWGGIKAADVQEMLDASKTLNPGKIDGRTFARQVLDRHRANLLEVVHGKEASEKLLEQARRIEMLAGRMDIPIRPGDTVTTVIARAQQAAEAAKGAAKADPIGVLNKEMKGIERDHAREVARMRRERRNDPLAFLYDPTTGAAEAANKILNNEDLLLAAAAKFGDKSPEFNMLRQVWAQRLLQGTLLPSKELEKVSPEIQNLMFPGVTLNQMKTLAKEMDFLNPKVTAMGTAGSMSAMAKVEHPWGGGLAKAIKIIPGSGTIGRAGLGKYYATMTALMNRPALFRFLERGLSGTTEEREATRQAISAVLQKGGAVGAGAGEAAYQGGGQ